MRMRVSVASVFAVYFASGASAQIAFDNFAPGNGFNFGQADIFSGVDALGVDIDVGISFVSEASGRLHEVEVALGLFAGTNSLSFQVYDANGILPGNMIYDSGQIDGAMRPVGLNLTPVSLEIDSAVHLSEGDLYFLVLSTSGDTEAVWHRNSVGDFGRVVGRTNNGPFGVMNRARNAARVTLVPSPGGGAAIAIGLCWISRSSRRRR